MAEGDLTGEAVEMVTDEMVFNAADSVGEVVNADGVEAANEEAQETATPLEVVLVLDASGSMDRMHSLNNKTILSYAQDASIAFSRALYAISPQSRIAVVSYADAAYLVRDFTTADEADALAGAIRGITLGNMTNTGSAMEMAVAMLDEEPTEGTRRVVVLLSDGLANEGAADPVQYAVDQGWAAAEDGLVYTVGLVGGMSESDRRITRQTLAAGYETRYFEVDFDDVGDITSQLTSVFMTVAMSGSTERGSFYRLLISGDLDFYIEDENGEYLSSLVWDYKDTASFGSFYTLGDSMNDKMVVLREGNYRITLHGSTTGTGLCKLVRISGLQAEETILYDQTLTTHPALYITLHLVDGQIFVTDESYEPLDIYAIDPMTGEQTRGLEVPARGTVEADTSVYAYPSVDGRRICKLGSRTYVQVLAHDAETDFCFISFANEGVVCRGWVRARYVTTNGYVPNMIWLDIPVTLTADVAAHYVPSLLTPEVEQLIAGTNLIVRHAERDTTGREWLYVQPEGEELVLLYIPCESVATWKEQTAPGFRLGYATAQYVWQTKLGSGYTEIMWAMGQKDGSGTILSGRTTSTKAPFSNNRGARDAFVVTMDSSGVSEAAITAGGSAIDSYHCIQPAAKGYYVSGITRSNNGDFSDTWDTSSTTASPSSTTKRSNALIGLLNEDFSISWLKSFGPGDASYGFDMVVELADGNIAGAGWMIDSSKGTLRGYGDQDFYVVKLKPDGTVLDAVCFGSCADDVPDSAVATPDGGLIMTGLTKRNGSRDGWILVLDSQLNVVSECVYGGRGDDIFDNVRAMPDGTYLVTGFTDSPSGNGVGTPKGGTDFWAMNIDPMGRSIWVKRYGGSGDEELCGTTILEDGTCLLLGSTTSTDGDILYASGRDRDALAMCIDTSGRLLWQYTSGLKGHDAFNASAVDPLDGGHVLCGLCDNSDSDTAKGLVIKLMPIGDLKQSGK